MSSNQLKSLVSKFKKFQEKNKEFLVDIVLFGSTSRGKRKPGDLDICFITSKPIEILKFKETIPVECHPVFLNIETIFNPEETLWRTIFHEGISLVTGKPLSRHLGFSPRTLFKYNLKILKKSEKVRFLYALKGRKENEGILSRADGKYLSRNLVLVPVSKEDVFEDFLTDWKIDFEKRRVFFET